MTTKCLWCDRDFERDPSMYKFCDSCIRKIEEAEEIVKRLTGTRINLARELEGQIPSQTKERR